MITSPLLILLTFAMMLSSLYSTASDASRSAPLSIRIKPEALIRISESKIKVVVRLAPGAKASVWSDAECKNPELSIPTVQLIKSGTYIVLPSEIGAKLHSKACVESSDGAFKVSEEIP